MPNASDAYVRLEGLFHDVAVLGDTIRLLHWDQAAMMPAGGGGARAEQLARLSAMRHDRLVAPGLRDLLTEAEASPDGLDEWQRANLREMRRQADRASAVPGDLVAAHSKASTLCEGLWREARRADDFPMVMPRLQEVLDLTRQVGDARAAVLGGSQYEALLAQFEPDGRTAAIDALFDDLAAFLPGFLDDALARQESDGPIRRPEGPFDIARQEALCRDMARTVGLDFESARMDESAHPFSSGVPEDSRITVRYSEDDFGEALMASLHETGHVMYERGRPKGWRYQPVGDARGMVLHESQSLLVEMQVCRSRTFYEWAAHRLRDAFDGAGDAWEADNLHRAATEVRRGLIRVDADEVTYPAHVLLRYRLERAMLSGDLALADLPSAWNDGLHDLLGIRPPDDSNGCLQDIHWYAGAWGYFPTYTLGALAAAQIFEAATAADAAILPAIGRGDFVPLMAWLRGAVHGQGSRLSTEALLVDVTGRPLGTTAFKDHLRRRYLDG